MVRARSNTGWMGYGQFAPTGRNNGVENPFAGTDYESLWDNNPYKDLYYQPTFWDYIGFSNKAKDANNEYERLYNEYIASIYDQQRQDEYNSPTAESERMKQAGLNPDLLGVSGASNTQAMNPMNAGANPALNGVSPAKDALSSISSVLGFAMSSLQQIQQMKGVSEGLLNQKIGNFRDLQELARPHIVSEYARRFSGQTANDWHDVKNTSAMSLNLSRRDSKRYRDAFTSLLSSSEFTSTESAYKSLSANDSALHHYIGGMAKLSYLAQKHQYQGQISKSIYDKNYFDNLDAGASSAATNRENNNIGWLDKWRNDFYRTLWNDFQKGSDLAGFLLIGSANVPSIGASWISGLSGFLNDKFPLNSK